MRTTERLPNKLAPPPATTCSRGTATRNFIAIMAIVLMATFARAQTPIPPSSQFDITGFIQVASLGGPGAGAHQGGSITVNGHVVTVPAETIVIPPNQLSGLPAVEILRLKSIEKKLMLLGLQPRVIIVCPSPS